MKIIDYFKRYEKLSKVRREAFEDGITVGIYIGLILTVIIFYVLQLML